MATAEPAVVTVEIADHPQVRALFHGVADALDLFARLSDAERDALPQDARAAIKALTGTCEAVGGRTVSDLTPYGSVIIEWAPPRGEKRPMVGWDTAVYDAATGEMLPGVMHMRLIDVDPSRQLTADLIALADEAGNMAAEPHLRNGDVITGVFRVDISEMRIRQQKP